MLNKSWIIAAVASFSLAGCLETDLQRGVAGAAAGVATAEVLGTDPLATGLAGASAGLLCDDAGICRPAR